MPYPLTCKRNVLLLLIGFCFYASAQETSKQESADKRANFQLEEVPRIPGVSTRLYGLDAELSASSVHDSFIGWHSVVTPTVSYTFSPRYSLDASVSIYPYRLASTSDVRVPGSSRLVTTRGDIGDTLLGVHGKFYARGIQHVVTANLTIPTGKRSDSLGSGHVTFDFDEHLEHYIHRMGLILDVGLGNSAGLFNALSSQDYNSVGPLAHFQSGFVLWLPVRSYFQSVAYEQLPIGDQKLYTTINRFGRPPITVVSGRKITEDNGFTSSVGIPLTSHIVLNSYYNRSLRLRLDTVSVGFTFVLREIPGKRKLSLVDKAILEAEGANTR